MSEKIDEQQLNKIQSLLLNWDKKCKLPEVSDDEAKVRVHQTIGKLSLFYEKFRLIIDKGHGHNECHKTLSRVLKRLLLLEKRTTETVAKRAIEEMIRAGFLPNDKTPKKNIKTVEDILEEYVVLMSKISVKISQAVINNKISKWYGNKRKREINRWIVYIATREVEKFLLPKNEEEVVVGAMYEYMVEQIEIEDKTISESEKNIQVYIAAHRALLRSNEDILSYYLFKRKYPNWSSASDEDLEDIAFNIFKTKKEIQKEIDHSIGDKLKRLCAANVVYFIVLLEILRDVGAREFAKMIDNKEALEEKITETVNKSYKKARNKIRFGMVKSTIYVLGTKAVSISEIPYFQNLNLGLIEYYAILFAGPTVMMLVGLSITKPSQKNTDKIIKVFNRMIFEDKIRTAPYQVRLVGRSFFLSLFFVLFYTVLFGVIIFAVYVILWELGLEPVVTSLALFFFSMISYFGFRLRQIMREYVVLDRKENLFGFIFDFISLPILELGQILATIVDYFNFFKPSMDYLAETPFKAFINFLEDWTHFVKEKKEGLDSGEH